MRYRVTGVSPNWNGIISMLIVAVLAGVLAMFSQWDLVKITLGMLGGLLLPMPANIHSEPEPIVVSDEHGVKHDT